MIIQNGLVFQENKSFRKRDLYIEKGRIVSDADELTDPSVINAEGMFVLPGLVDVHIHGASGHDFSDGSAEGLKKILSYQLKHGVTTCCPTTMSLPEECLLKIFDGIRDFRKNTTDFGTEPFSRIAGIHLEGPFLDPARKGSHKEEYLLSPDGDFFRKCFDACDGMIRLVTIAPNLKGALKLIEEIREKTVVSLGHTGADYETARAAFQAGASHITHLFNAMAPLHHRNPGLIGAASEDQSCMAELICDGVHVHESAVRAAFRLFPGRIVLISDSIRGTGLGDGVFELGGQQVTVSGKRAVLKDGTIAGSVTNLYDCMRNAVSFGVPIEEAVSAASFNAAESIGLSHEIGSLSPGKRADILLTDRNLNLLKVIRSGYSVDGSFA